MLKSKSKIIGILAVICAAICVAFAGCAFTNYDYEEVYNDDAMIATCNSSKRIGSVESSVNGSYNLSCSSLSGVYTIKSITVNENTSANLKLEVSEGKCKVVLIKSTDVYTLKEGSYDGALDFTDIPNGSYKLKVVGVDAHIKLTLNY